MARKRLNKKVALIGSLAFVFLVLAAILLFLYLSRDPEKFIKDGDVALMAAREATDAQIKEDEYKKAEHNYHKARALSKTDPLKIEMLFKLVDIYMETDQWRSVLGCWNTVIQIEPKNIRARFGRLQYVYLMADSAVNQVWLWQEVESQVSEFIEIADDANLLMEDTAQWEYPLMQKTETVAGRLGSYLYQCRGRAFLEIAGQGAVTDPNSSLSEATSDLEKALEFEPTNVETYRNLAQTLVTRGEILASKGDVEGRDKNRKQATELLSQAVEVSGANVEAHINLLAMKSVLAQESGREQIKLLEPEYLSLVEKFGSDARAFSALRGFYSRLGREYLDKAVDASEKAVELDGENVDYAIYAANLHYQRFSIHGQKPDVYRAIELANNAFTLPDAQDKPGPREGVNRKNRISLYLFLANCYIEQVLEPCEVRTEEETKKWLADAEQMVHGIEQIFGSGEDPHVVQWQGMLELAKGNRSIAVKKLYAAYEQLKASGIEDAPPSILRYSYAHLSYILAKIFEDTSELGAVREYLSSALRTGIAEIKPEALLDYAEMALKLRGYSAALSGVNFFENEYWSSQRSQILRIKAYIAAMQFNEAEEELAKRQPDDPNTIELNLALVESKIEQLQRVAEQKEMEKDLGVIFTSVAGEEKQDVNKPQIAELETNSLLRAKLIGKLLQVKPDAVGEDSVAAACDRYIAQGKSDQAKELVNRFLEHFPANTTILIYKQILSEPEPGKISQQGRKEIEEQVLSGIPDPVEKSMKLGVFYQEHNEPNEAAEEFKKVLKIEASQKGDEKPAFVLAGDITDSQRLAVDYLFDIMLEKENWDLAKQITEAARQGNIDDCDGQFFIARLALARKKYSEALTRLDACLKQKPIFSRAFMLRSNANAVLGNEHASIEDAKKAASLNPMDKNIAKGLAFVLYLRNEKLGDNISSEQIVEARDALNRAMALNTDDLQLRSFYAEYMVAVQPLAALAIRQRLQKTDPSLLNAVLLGRMAAKLASNDDNAERKDALFAIAASSFEQARKIDPNSRLMLTNYAEYLRVSGQDEKARQLLQESQDQKLLWTHYFQGGQFEAAKDVLEQLYQADQKDSNSVKGLLLVAEKTNDAEAVKRYSEELLSLEDSLQNRLFQIQVFLEVGLTKDAEYKLQSFKEKFPDEQKALLLEAWLSMKQGQLEKSLELANRYLEAEQNNASAWRLRGQINLLTANYGQAIIDLKRSKSLLPDPLTRFALARAYQRAGRGEDAITELEGLIDNPQAPMQARVLLEQLYWQLQKKEALKSFYDETLKKFPDSVDWYNRAGAFAVTMGETDRAEQLYKQALQKVQGNSVSGAMAIDGYLGTLIAGGKFDKLFEEAGKYVDGDFASITFVKMAEVKLKLGDRGTAIQYLRKAVDKAGSDEVLIDNILQRMYRLLGAEETLKYCEERLKTDPDSLAANMAIFNLKKMNGEYNNAVDYIDKCLQIIGPNSPERADYIGRKAEILTLAYGKTSDNTYLEKAITEYESLLDKMPNEPEILNNLAYMLAEADVRLDDAVEYSKKACEIVPNNPGFMETYSYALYKNGKLSEAAESMQSALQQYEQNRISAPSEVYEHLGMIKEGLGSINEAIAAYRQALELATAEKSSEVVIGRIKAAIERLE
ncbi:MAG: tetratricopeptide repeat protein [Phycisphaerae bacterium]|nr:tetratricopeptide repeat protein [Phycisphaerae bacterium]